MNLFLSFYVYSLNQYSIHSNAAVLGIIVAVKLDPIQYPNLGHQTKTSSQLPALLAYLIWLSPGAGLPWLHKIKSAKQFVLISPRVCPWQSQRGWRTLINVSPTEQRARSLWSNFPAKTLNHITLPQISLSPLTQNHKWWGRDQNLKAFPNRLYLK